MRPDQVFASVFLHFPGKGAINPGLRQDVAGPEWPDGRLYCAFVPADELAGLYDEFTLLSEEANALRARVEAAVQGILER